MSIESKTHNEPWEVGADFLEGLRSFFNLSKTELAGQLTVSHVHLSRYMREDGEPLPRKLRRLALKLDRQRRIVTILREHGLFTFESEHQFAEALARGTSISVFLSRLLGCHVLHDIQCFLDEEQSLNPKIRGMCSPLFPEQDTVLRLSSDLSPSVVLDVKADTNGYVLFAAKCILCGCPHGYSTVHMNMLAKAVCVGSNACTNRRCVRIRART